MRDSPECGAVAHLGERFNGIEEVGGSSPPSSTTLNGGQYWAAKSESPVIHSGYRTEEAISMAEKRELNAESSAVQTHLNILQDVIKRMAENSRFCKVWCLTVVSAILVVSVRILDSKYVLIALGPALMFFYLDVYYLALEQKFRDSYNEFVKKLHLCKLSLSDLYKIANNSMTFNQFLYGFRSWSTTPFYIVIIIGIICFTSFLMRSKGL